MPWPYCVGVCVFTLPGENQIDFVHETRCFCMCVFLCMNVFFFIHISHVCCVYDEMEADNDFH